MKFIGGRAPRWPAAAARSPARLAVGAEPYVVCYAVGHTDSGGAREWR